MATPEPRPFLVVREEDESGVSGRGRALDGIIWHNGWVSVCWRTNINQEHGYTSVGFYPNWEAFEKIHISPHPGNKTKIEWHELEETP